MVTGTTVWPLMLVPLSVTFSATLCSSLSPPLVKWNVKVGGGLAGSVFVDPV